VRSKQQDWYRRPNRQTLTILGRSTGEESFCRISNGSSGCNASEAARMLFAASEE
jgi:hypothetical protein